MTKERGRGWREKGAVDKKMLIILYFDLVTPYMSNLYLSKPKCHQLLYLHRVNTGSHHSQVANSCQEVRGGMKKFISNTNRGP